MSYAINSRNRLSGIHGMELGRTVGKCDRWNHRPPERADNGQGLKYQISEFFEQ